MKLGNPRAKYPSRESPGAVSACWEGLGGVCYGIYQLASNTGGVQGFVNWLLKKGHSSANLLNLHQPGSREFSSAWKFCAENYHDFGSLQHDYVKFTYYQPAVISLGAAGFNLENHHDVMKDVVCSRAVQYGAAYIVELFEDACRLLGHPNLSHVDTPGHDKAMITSLYMNVCKTRKWANGLPLKENGLYPGLDEECGKLLKLLERSV